MDEIETENHSMVNVQPEEIPQPVADMAYYAWVKNRAPGLDTSLTAFMLFLQGNSVTSIQSTDTRVVTATDEPLVITPELEGNSGATYYLSINNGRAYIDLQKWVTAVIQPRYSIRVIFRSDNDGELAFKTDTGCIYNSNGVYGPVETIKAGTALTAIDIINTIGGGPAIIPVLMHS